MMTPKDSERFLETFRKDCEFFEHMGIIDYSLLIGEHVVSHESPNHEEASLDLTESIVGAQNHASLKEKPNVIVSADRKWVYFLGIIDILTKFNKKKKFEYLFKKTIYGKGISCIPPKEYSIRIQKFIKSSIVSVS